MGQTKKRCILYSKEDKAGNCSRQDLAGLGRTPPVLPSHWTIMFVRYSTFLRCGHSETSSCLLPSFLLPLFFLSFSHGPAHSSSRVSFFSLTESSKYIARLFASTIRYLCLYGTDGSFLLSHLHSPQPSTITINFPLHAPPPHLRCRSLLPPSFPPPRSSLRSPPARPLPFLRHPPKPAPPDRGS